MYHYTQSGLRNVWLKNGYTASDTAYGKGVSIEDIAGLHAAIALVLYSKPGRLTGPEIRYLRKEIEMSQATLGGLLGVSAQTVALWEKSKSRITIPAERLLRLIVKGFYSGKVHIKRAIQMMNDLEVARHEGKLLFAEDGKKWKAA